MSQPLTILAVDDDAPELANTRAMLEDLGHTVVLAYSGEQSLERLECTPTIDLVITDHAMPKMPGTELAERIRARRPAMPIILATGICRVAGRGCRPAAPVQAVLPGRTGRGRGQRG